jgi:hypothetical protein
VSADGTTPEAWPWVKSADEGTVALLLLGDTNIMERDDPVEIANILSFEKGPDVIDENRPAEIHLILIALCRWVPASGGQPG